MPKYIWTAKHIFKSKNNLKKHLKSDEKNFLKILNKLEKAGMIANHNGIPKDPRPPMQTSGIRLGTPAVTTRNMGVKEMEKIAEWIDRVIVSKGDSKVQEEVKNVSTRILIEGTRFPPPGSMHRPISCNPFANIPFYL